MNMDNGFNIVLIFVALLLKGRRAAITVRPSNEVASIGEQIKLGCSADTAIAYWYFSKNGVQADETTITNIGCTGVIAGFTDHYAVESIAGGTRCNLIVANITMAQAGVYRCQEATNQAFSILTVIEKDPILAYNATGKEVKEHDNVAFECSLNYMGSTTPAPTLRPYFYWTNTGGQTVPTYSNSTTDSTAVSQLTVTAGRQDIPSYTCHVYFQLDPPITPSYSNNTPTISSNASSPIIEVSYAPSTPAITSKPAVIAIDGVPCGISVLTCSSEGNPTPTYKWFDSAMNILSNNSTLTLAEINRRYRCEAKNTIGTTSANIIVSQDNCSSTVQCCVFPHDETTTANRKGCDNGTLCDCSKNKSGITLFCNVTTFPNASYIWTGPEGITFGPTDSPVYDQVTANGTYQCTAHFDKSLSNYSGGVDFPNGTSSIPVNDCSAAATKEPTTSISPTTTLKTTISSTPENQTTKAPSDNTVVVIVVPVVVCYISINFVAIGLFIWYYDRAESPPSGTGARNEAVKKAANKNRLNKRFPWLQKMLPCMNDTRENTGTNVLWVSLFVLLGIFAGIVAFPTLVILSIKYESNNETSALTKRENGGEGNEGVGNGRRPGTAPLSPNQTMAQDPYQNESTINIELKISHQSGGRPKASPKPITSPTGKPPAPPDRKNLRLSDRANIYVDTEPGQSPEYAELPIAKNPPTKPVQYLDDQEDSYAALKKT